MSSLPNQGPAPDQQLRLLREKISELERRLAEQQRSERRVRTRDAATRALVSSPSLADAAPRLLQAICEAMRWQMGALWRVDPRWNLLRCISTWHAPSVDVGEFEAVTKKRTFQPGVGLPGMVWNSRQPEWLNTQECQNFPRAAIA